MLTRATRIKLIAFAVIATLSVAIVGINYAGGDRLLGPRGYVVTAELADSGGIFEGAAVTYRGIEVGEVASMRLTEQGLDVDLDIADDAPRIPQDTAAVVTNRSAVGEQHVDLRPDSSGEPYLEDGSIIDQESTDIPTAPHEMLASVDQLVTSVDTQSLRTMVGEVDEAFTGTGEDLQVLLDTAHSFTERAQESLPETRQLLTSGRTALDTQRRNADNITEFSSGLNDIADQFAESDPDLREVIDRTPQVGEQVSDFLARSGNHLGTLMANLLTTANIMEVRTDATEQLLVNFGVLGAFPKSVSEDGQGKLGLVMDTFTFDPPACVRGYESTEQRPANDTSEAEPNTEAYCAEPPGSPVAVRGSQNTPFADDPVEAAEPGQEAPDESEGSAEHDGEQGTDEELPGVLQQQETPDGSGGIGDLLGVGE